MGLVARRKPLLCLKCAGPHPLGGSPAASYAQSLQGGRGGGALERPICSLGDKRSGAVSLLDWCAKKKSSKHSFFYALKNKLVTDKLVFKSEILLAVISFLLLFLHSNFIIVVIKD